MSYIIGHFTCKLDAKGRLMLPAEFKEQLGEQVEEGFVLRPATNKSCIELYLRRDWDAVQDKMREKFNLYDETHLAAIRFYNAGARVAKLDANGRIQIPKDIMDLNLVEKEVVVESVANKMEIWDKSRYDEVMNAIDSDKVMELFKEFLK